MSLPNVCAALGMIVLLMLPQTGSAWKTALEDGDLSGVVGQAGFAKEKTLKFDVHEDTLPVMNGFLTLSDVDIQGSMTTRDSSADMGIVDQTTDLDLPGVELTGLGLTVLKHLGFGADEIDATINIDQLSIGAIHTAGDINGPSFGSVDVIGANITIMGSAPVTQR